MYRLTSLFCAGEAMMTEGVTDQTRGAQGLGPGLQHRAHAGQRRSLGGALRMQLFACSVHHTSMCVPPKLYSDCRHYRRKGDDQRQAQPAQR